MMMMTFFPLVVQGLLVARKFSESNLLISDVRNSHCSSPEILSVCKRERFNDFYRTETQYGSFAAS
jgi:hypothetical protein